jgi:hypothetical protein
MAGCADGESHPGKTKRIAPDELVDGVGYVDHCTGFFKPAPDLQVPNIVSILNEAASWFEKRQPGQKRGLVIGPWNELGHMRPDALSETEYISRTLSAVRQWAREFEVHVWIVAHPMKLQKEEGRKLSGVHPLRHLRLGALAQQGGQLRCHLAPCRRGHALGGIACAES